MTIKTRLVGATIGLVAMSMAAVAQAPQLDPKIVGFKLPDQIVWKDNPTGGNRQPSCRAIPPSPDPTPCCCNGCRAT